MASDVAPRIKHDVFISFRGEDTRRNFTGHLRAALDRNGINAFTDKGLRGGEEISHTLSSKISESQVSVVVFSPNYADSRWCLDELVMIMECKAAHGQTVLPVFLQGVEPTHVRKQTGAFGEGFARLSQDARYADKVKGWRRALKQTANLSGWTSDQISEEKIVDKILSRVQSVLDQISSDDLYQPFIGIERVDKVESILSSPEVRHLGLWGLPGSGKTTLAGMIYHRISKNFDAACFIENVKEFAARHQLNGLRNSLLSQLLEKHDQIQGPPIIFRSDIQRKLGRRRVLVVLDDVSDVGQLQELIGDSSLLCPGSKVITTCRDQQVLKNVCDQVFEVKELNEHIKPTFEGDRAILVLSQERSLACASFGQRALIGRLIMPKGSKTTTTFELKASLSKIWPVTSLKMLPLGLGYFGFEFLDEKERALAWHSPKWKLPQGMLYLQPWVPFFRPKKIISSLARVWVKLVGLSMEHVTDDITFCLAALLGTPIRGDPNALNRFHGAEVRILVEVDLTKPRREMIYLKEEAGLYPVKVVYEDLPSFCDHCKRVGHSAETCFVLHPRGKDGSDLTSTTNLRDKKVMQAGESRVRGKQVVGSSGSKMCQVWQPKTSEPAKKVAPSSIQLTNSFDMLREEEEGRVRSGTIVGAKVGDVIPEALEGIDKDILVLGMEVHADADQMVKDEPPREPAPNTGDNERVEEGRVPHVVRDPEPGQSLHDKSMSQVAELDVGASDSLRLASQVTSPIVGLEDSVTSGDFQDSEDLSWALEIYDPGLANPSIGQLDAPVDMIIVDEDSSRGLLLDVIEFGRQLLEATEPRGEGVIEASVHKWDSTSSPPVCDDLGVEDQEINSSSEQVDCIEPSGAPRLAYKDEFVPCMFNKLIGQEWCGFLRLDSAMSMWEGLVGNESIKKIWRVLFDAILWGIWRHRNKSCSMGKS